MPPIKDEGAPLAFSEIQDEFGEFDITSGLIEYWGAASTLPKVGEEIAFSDFYGAVDLRLSLTLSQSADTELEAAYAGRDEIIYAPEEVRVDSGTAYFGFTNTGQTDGQPESDGFRIFSRDGKDYYATGSGNARLATQVVGSQDVTERLTPSNAGYHGWTATSETIDGKAIWTNGSTPLANNNGYLDVQTWNPATSTLAPVTPYNYREAGYTATGTFRFGAWLYTKNGNEYWYYPRVNNLATRVPVIVPEGQTTTDTDFFATTASDFGFVYQNRSAYGYQVWRFPGDSTDYYLFGGYIVRMTNPPTVTYMFCSFSYTNISDFFTIPAFYSYTAYTRTRTKPVYTYTNVPNETRPTVPQIGPTPAYGYDLARKYLYRKSQEGGPMYETVGSWPQTNHFSNNWKPAPATGFSIIQYFSDKMGVVNGQISPQGREVFTAAGVAPADFVGDNIPARLTFDIGQGDASELSYDTFYRLYRSQTNGNVTLGYISPQNSANKPTFTATISGTQTNIILSNLDATRTYRLRWAAYQGAKFTAGSIGPSVSGVSDEFLGDSAPVLTLTGGDDQAYSDFRQGVDLYLEVQVVSLPIVVWAVTRCFEYFRNGDSKLVEANCDFLDGFSSESELLAN